MQIWFLELGGTDNKCSVRRLAILGGEVNEKEVQSVMSALAESDFAPNYNGYSNSQRSLHPVGSFGDSAMLASNASSLSGNDSVRFDRSSNSQTLAGPSTSTISIAGTPFHFYYHH